MKKILCFGKGRMFLLLSVFTLTLFSLSSCKSKEEGVISDLTDLVEKVESKSADMSDDDWEAVIKDYENITKAASECDFTDEQLKEVASLETKFMAKAGKAYMKKAFNKAGDIFNQAGNLLEGAMEGITEGLEE